MNLPFTNYQLPFKTTSAAKCHAERSEASQEILRVAQNDNQELTIVDLRLLTLQAL